MIQPKTAKSTYSPATPSRRTDPWLWFGPLLFMMVVGAYFLARYTGTWAEADSTTFTNAIRPIVNSGRLIPDEEGAVIYPNGFGYQAISSVIVVLTGLDVSQIQLAIYPLLGFIIVLPAWLLYRELTGSARGATLATMLLLTQPEFLFVVLRSSHEKFTRMFMLLCLFLLLRSFKLRNQPRMLAVHVVLFYVLVFALIAGNSFLAHTFIFATVVALVLGTLLQSRFPHMRPKDPTILKRLLYIILIGLGLAYIFIFFIYPPSANELNILRDTGERLAALFLDFATTGGQNATNAYAYVASGWVSLYAYFLVSIGNWILLLVSLCVWASQGLRWLWRRETPPTDAAWLLWLLYTAFAMQGVISILVDASGALSSNLQHRLFPSFALIAAAVVGGALAEWRPKRFATQIQAGLMAGLACIAILSVFKATNEPLLSNKWTFYRPAELTALEWTDVHLKNAEVWTEFDERLKMAYQNAHGPSANRNRLTLVPSSSARTLLASSVTRLRSSRLQYPVPIPHDALRVYDNGEAEVYQLRPRTPYQQ